MEPVCLLVFGLPPGWDISFHRWSQLLACNPFPRYRWLKAIVSSTSGAVRRRLPYRSFYEFLFGHASSFKRWWVDPRSAIAVVHALGRDRLFLHDSIVQEMKEVKNTVEALGMRNSHARECGAAVVRSWVVLTWVWYIWMAWEDGILRWYGQRVVRVEEIDRIWKVISLFYGADGKDQKSLHWPLIWSSGWCCSEFGHGKLCTRPRVVCLYWDRFHVHSRRRSQLSVWLTLTHYWQKGWDDYFR